MWYSGFFQRLLLNASISVRRFLGKQTLSSGRRDKIVFFAALERLLCAVRIVSVLFLSFRFGVKFATI